MAGDGIFCDICAAYRHQIVFAPEHFVAFICAAYRDKINKQLQCTPIQNQPLHSAPIQNQHVYSAPVLNDIVLGQFSPVCAAYTRD